MYMYNIWLLFSEITPTIFEQKEERLSILRDNDSFFYGRFLDTARFEW